MSSTDQRPAARSVDRPSGQCRPYNVSPGVCRKRRTDVDGPALPGSSCAASLRCMSSAASAASSLLLPSRARPGPLLAVVVLRAAAWWAASTSVETEGQRRGQQGWGRRWELGRWASAPTLRSGLQGGCLNRRSSMLEAHIPGTHKGLASGLTDLPTVAFAWASVGDQTAASFPEQLQGGARKQAVGTSRCVSGTTQEAVGRHCRDGSDCLRG